MRLLSKIKCLLTGKSSFDEIEDFLLSNDFGVDFTSSILTEMKENKINSHNLMEAFKDKVEAIVSAVDSSMRVNNIPPTVYLFVGSNGSGKTTTIAKIANKLKKNGKSVLVVAGDTFRAGAIEQLSEWADRIQVPVVKQALGSDPASVIYDGLDSGIVRKVDFILIDTSGRVETKKNLIGELKKIYSVISKKIERVPDEILLVLDAYIGQNALSQIDIFKEAVPITGIVLSKFDGSASGGTVLPIIQQYGIPVKLMGTGEGIEDIEVFSCEKYLKKLV